MAWPFLEEADQVTLLAMILPRFVKHGRGWAHRWGVWRSQQGFFVPYSAQIQYHVARQTKPGSFIDGRCRQRISASSDSEKRSSSLCSLACHSRIRNGIAAGRFSSHLPGQRRASDNFKAQPIT